MKSNVANRNKCSMKSCVVNAKEMYGEKGQSNGQQMGNGTYNSSRRK